jgi:hypothetical protein
MRNKMQHAGAGVAETGSTDSRCPYLWTEAQCDKEEEDVRDVKVAGRRMMGRVGRDTVEHGESGRTDKRKANVSLSERRTFHELVT